MNNKKISNEIAIGIILLVVVLIGGAFYFQNKKVATTIPEIKQAQQKDQQTTMSQQNQAQQQEQVVTVNAGELYKNNEFGFEFMSPQNLVTTSKQADSDVVFSDRPGGHWIYNIRISNNQSNLSLVDVFNQEIEKYNKSGKKVISTIVNIDGKSAKRFSVQKYTDYGNAGVITINENKIVAIYGDDSSSNKVNFEKIMSSFKFIK